ncbi:MAG TPA: sialidase family protein [Terriglobales bacterium]
MRAIIIGLVAPAVLAVGALAQTTLARATLQCSPAPCVLRPALASEKGQGEVTDPAIAASPTDARQLLLGSADGNCGDLSSVGFHLSSDGGSTWTRVDCMPAIRDDNRPYNAVDEPSVGYDAKGSAYVSGVYADLAHGGGDYGFIGVQKSSNGKSWSTPVAALIQPGKSSPYLSHLAVDATPSSPFAGAVYVSGILVSYPGADTQVWVSHTNDGGSTWTPTPVDSAQKNPYSDAMTRMAVGKNGAVYVTWLTGDTNPGPIVFSMSSDGGNTWSAPHQVTTVTGITALPNTGERDYNYPSIAVDNSNGPYSGNLYVVMYTWTGSYLKVQMVRSIDGGKTWSKPIPLAPESDTHDQFFPAISVNKDGLVGVSWLDRRNDPKDIDYQAFAAISYDGGQTFGPNWQLTTKFSNPKVGNNDWIGDYTSNTWVDDKFIASWMDSSNGTDMQIVVGGVQLK